MNRMKELQSNNRSCYFPFLYRLNVACNFYNIKGVVEEVEESFTKITMKLQTKK